MICVLVFIVADREERVRKQTSCFWSSEAFGDGLTYHSISIVEMSPLSIQGLVLRCRETLKPRAPFQMEFQS